MNTQIQTIQKKYGVQHWSSAQKELIKNTVAGKATDDELEMFLHLAQKYQLDPFAKEIWFIKYRETDKPQIFTSRDGYLKIAHQSGVFDGMESYTIDDEKGFPIKAVCKIYRKDVNRPFQAEIKVNEYMKKNQIWEQYPSAMAIKVAEVFALKRAFCINGFLTQEECELEDKEINQKTDTLIKENLKITDTTITQKQLIRLRTIAGKNGWKPEQCKDYLLTMGYESAKDILVKDYDTICNYFEKYGPHWQKAEGQVDIIEEKVGIEQEENN